MPSFVVVAEGQGEGLKPSRVTQKSVLQRIDIFATLGEKVIDDDERVEVGKICRSED